MTMTDLTAALLTRGFAASTSTSLSRVIGTANVYDTDGVRVVVTPEDGIDVLGWATGPGYGAGVLAWSASFDSNTPDAIVLAAVDAAVTP